MNNLIFSELNADIKGTDNLYFLPNAVCKDKEQAKQLLMQKKALCMQLGKVVAIRYIDFKRKTVGILTLRKGKV